LDDDAEFTEDLKTNISSLGPEFFSSVSSNIDCIEVITASEPDVAFKIINDENENIALLIVDIELRYTKGYDEYDRLFREGRAIPAIVVSAFVNTPERRAAINSAGISVIIDKWKQDDLSEEIARSICRVLDNAAERNLQLRVMVERLKILRHEITACGKTATIEEWLKELVGGKITRADETSIREEITNECGRAFRMAADHNKGFKHEDW
jgi:CheY-like chemotaxis protein